jgi:hypothetical protein
MSYKVRIEMEFPWTDEEATVAEWLLVCRYGLQDIRYNRLPIAIRAAVLEVVNREAMKAATKLMLTAEVAERPPEPEL